MCYLLAVRCLYYNICINFLDGTSKSVPGPSQIPEPRPESVEDSYKTPKKRKFSEPRYIGDIKTPDIATPRRAKRCLFMAKTKIDQQSSHIKILKQQNRRLLKKIRTMQDLVDHLRKKNLISEDCQDNLVVSLKYVYIFFFFNLAFVGPKLIGFFILV